MLCVVLRVVCTSCVVCCVLRNVVCVDVSGRYLCVVRCVVLCVVCSVCCVV